MNKRQAMGYRNLDHYMIGKTDHAGRLMDDNAQAAIAEAKRMRLLRAYPNHPAWEEMIDKVIEELIDLMGDDAWDKYVETLSDEPKALMEIYDNAVQKLHIVKSMMVDSIA